MPGDYSEVSIPLARCIPNRDDWAKLIPPLTEGEMALALKLDDELPPGWSIAVQRKLNNSVPDILCFHPRFGLIVFEVKDWDPRSREFKKSGPHLFARNINSADFYIADDPVGQVMHYKKILSEAFPVATDAEILITCVVALTKFSNKESEDLLEHFRPATYSTNSHRPYLIFAGYETLTSPITTWLPPVSRVPNQHLETYRRDLPLSERVADRFMWLLRVPELEIERYQPLELDEQKVQFLRNTNQTKRRKVRGAVGSGKSTLLAARAAQAISDGKKVLIISFTISLRHWLHRLIVRAGIRHSGLTQSEFSQRAKELVWRWYVHEFAREIATTAGRGTEFNRLLGSSKNYPEEEIVSFTETCMNDFRVKRDHKYDVVLIDELQNVDKRWIEILNQCVASDGEMIILGDPTQNVYTHDLAWTKESVPGFPGRWTSLKGSYRFPPAMYPALQDFYESFALETDVSLDEDKPVLASESLFDTANMLWTSVDSTNMHSVAAKFIRQSDEQGVAPMDTALLVMTHGDGRDVLKLLTGQDRPSQEIAGYVHIFGNTAENTAHLKKAFWPMRGEKKLCTVHSFQGWEARYVVLLICEKARIHEEAGSYDFFRTVYVGLSRLARSRQTSTIIVVNAERSLDSYFERHFQRVT